MSKNGNKKTNAGKLNLSAGILVFRQTAPGAEVLLAHPGGPFWKNKDNGVWTIPKGEPEPGEDNEAAARREFLEESGWDLGDRQLQPLQPVKQKAGKWIHAWLAEGDKPADELRSNEFELEWPPHSGKRQSFPEIDRFAWMNLSGAREKINPAQIGFLDELEEKLHGR